MAYPQAHVRRKRRSRYRSLPGPLTGRRLAALLAVLVLTPLLIYGVRVVGGLSRLTGSNPGAVLGCLVKIKCDSQLATTTQRINVALYGYGGNGHDGAYLTDSIMVVSIQPRPGRTAQVAEISIPRDWMVPIDAAGGKPYYGRVNEAYSDGQGQSPVQAPRYKGDSQGGGKLANQTLQSVLGLHIDHFVGVDFQAFQAAVDSVGGVDVDVPDSFTDNQYPHGECDKGDCRYMTVHFTKGMQHMDGARALIFARSRHSYDNPAEASNFARNHRQQLILNALKQKVLSVGGIGKLPDLLSALGDHVITDLGIADANALYDLVKNVDSKSIVHVSVDDSNFLYECGYPRNCTASYEYAHDKTYATLQRYLRDLFPDPATLAQHTPVTVEDGTGQGVGSATRWTQLLGDVGFSTTEGGTVRRTATTQVIDSTPGGGNKTAQWLANYFGVAVTTAPSVDTAAASSPPPTGSAAAGGGVTLVLGQDSERAWNGNGQGYPSDPALNAPSTYTPAAAQQQQSSTTTASTPRPTRAPTPPPSTPPPSTPAPTLCVPPICKPHP
jgi:polyisoprenyl-teichoic acid--peptidoglycan teichoic acid transferase